MKKRSIDENTLEHPHTSTQQKRPKFSERDPFEEIPLGVLTMILSNTGHQMMLPVKLVCKRWLKACNSKIFYEKMLEDYTSRIVQDFGIPASKYQLIPAFFEDRPWKELFELKTLVQASAPVSGRRLGTKMIEGIAFYEGELDGNEMSGHGYLYKRNQGLIYEGQFENSKITGRGKRYWVNNDHYEGEFLNSKKHGRGTLSITGVGVYTGEFVSDKREGEGTMVFENGDVYTGAWKNDMTNGRGVIVSKTGGYRYDGEWLNNQKHGQGVLRYHKGVYEGEWRNNKAHGKGRITFNNGSLYEGDIYENHWHGNGQFVWADGRRYEGSFKLGKQQGRGKIFIKGVLCYEGCFKDDKPHGEGVLYFPNGCVYEGRMKNGKREGAGRVLDEQRHLILSGNFSEGNCVDGNIHDHEKLSHYFPQNPLICKSRGAAQLEGSEVTDEVGMLPNAEMDQVGSRGPRAPFVKNLLFKGHLRGSGAISSNPSVTTSSPLISKEMFV